MSEVQSVPGTGRGVKSCPPTPPPLQLLSALPKKESLDRPALLMPPPQGQFTPLPTPLPLWFSLGTRLLFLFRLVTLFSRVITFNAQISPF